MISKKIFIKIVIILCVFFLNELYILPVAPTGLLKPYSIRKYAHESSFSKICFSNQRLLTGACELYDEDHEVGLLSAFGMNFDAAEKVLVSEKYLKKPITPATDKCCYDFYKLNANEYMVYCKLHGSTLYSSNNLLPGPSAEQYTVDTNYEQRRKKMTLLKSIAFYAVIVAAIVFI